MLPRHLRRVRRLSLGSFLRTRPFILMSLFLTICWLSSVDSSTVTADTNTFTEAFRGTGRYGYVAQGVGTRGDPDTGAGIGVGDITLTIPDSATIVKAHLSWTGRSNAYDVDGVMLGVDNGPAELVQAMEQIQQDPWCCNAQQRREVADITDLGVIQPGTHVYNVSDHEHSTSAAGDFLNYGVGIWVIYEDAGEEWGEIVVFEGQDSFFRLWEPPIGPHSEVRCFDFEPDEQDRVVKMTHLVSGVDTEYGIRSNAFWYLTGSGDKSPDDEMPDLINRPGAIGYRPQSNEYPFQSYMGLEWDNFEPAEGILVPGGDTWACFQIESGDSQNLAGLNNEGYPASGMWGMFAVKLPLEPPTAVSLISFDVPSVWGHQVTLRWETAAEQDHFGFNLYRSATDHFAHAQKIHFEPAVIPGGAPGGAIYTFTDDVPAAGTYRYWLESVDTNGVTKEESTVQTAVSGMYTLYLPAIFR